MVDIVDFKKFPPSLPRDVKRVDADGLPTTALLDQEDAQSAGTLRALQNLNQSVIELGDEGANYQSQIDTLNDGLSAEVTARETLSTTVDGNTADLEVLRESVDGISVKYSVVGTVGGTFGGMVIQGAQQNGGGAIFEVGFAASHFWLVDPNLPGGYAPVFNYNGTYFEFGVPVKITTTLLAPNAVYKKVRADLGAQWNAPLANGTHNVAPLTRTITIDYPGTLKILSRLTYQASTNITGNMSLQILVDGVSVADLPTIANTTNGGFSVSAIDYETGVFPKTVTITVNAGVTYSSPSNDGFSVLAGAYYLAEVLYFGG